jgi:hypothetical protein
MIPDRIVGFEVQERRLARERLPPGFSRKQRLNA